MSVGRLDLMERFQYSAQNLKVDSKSSRSKKPPLRRGGFTILFLGKTNAQPSLSF
jgi:hypothetical protein